MEFTVIYADPPWRYSFSRSASRRVENQYPTMSVDDICALDVQSICSRDAVLFLWATAPKLLEALRVVDAWGFEYVTQAVWDKEIIGMGYYFRGQHEILLVGKRGNPGVPEPARRVSSVIRERRTKHSKKPDSIRSIITRMYPCARRLEIFARKQSAGWAVWGDEV